MCKSLKILKSLEKLETQISFMYDIIEKLYMCICACMCMCVYMCIIKMCKKYITNIYTVYIT